MTRPRDIGVNRLTGQDLGNLWPELVGWPQEIGVMGVVDPADLMAADGGLRVGLVRAAIDRRLHLAPRLRQVVLRPRFGLGGPLWVDARSFDLVDHVRVLPVPAPGGEAELLRACADLRRIPLDPSRPPWQLWLMPGLAGGRLGLFLRLHHVIADGVAGVALIGALLGPDAVGTATAAPPWTPRPAPPARALLADALRRRVRGIGRLGSVAAHPARTARRARANWPAMREVFAEAQAPRTSLNRPIGADRRVGLVRGRLDLAKEAARAEGGTVNDVVLAAVAGGLRDLLLSRGEPVTGLVLRVAVPVSLHPAAAEATGNLDGGMAVPLPVGEPDALRRLRLIAADTATRKARARPQVYAGIMASRAAARVALWIMGRQRMVNLSVSNVPGPRAPLHLAGARLLEAYPVISLMGNLTLGVVVLSYAGQLNLTVVADRDGCPDLPVFLAGVERSLAELETRRPPVPSI
jgi:WS/DGAT/MGAT family acyltransferase